MSRLRLAQETLLLTGAQAAALAISFAAAVLITRALGPEARGVYAWVLTLAGLGVQTAALAAQPTVRTVAAQNPGDPRLAASLALLGFGGTCLTLPFLVYGWLEPNIGRHAHALLAIAWLSVPLTSAATSLIVLVHLRQRTLAILAAHLGPKLVLLGATLVLWRTGALDLRSAVWLNTLVALVQFGLLLALIRQPTRAFRPDPALMRRLAGLLGAGWFSALALYAVPRIGFVLLGSHAPLAVSGHYSVAMTLFEVLAILPVSAGSVLASHFSRKGVPGRRLEARAAGLMLGAMTVLAAAAALISPILIPLLFGAAFAPAVEPLIGLLPALVLGAGYQVLHAALQALGRPVLILLPPAAAIAATLPAAMLLIPELGIGGAVLSTVLGFAVLACTAAALCWSALR